MQKTAGPEKFSFYLISRIDDVKTWKNWFLRQFLEFEASVYPVTAYSECAELYLGAEECDTHMFSRFDYRQYLK